MRWNEAKEGIIEEEGSRCNCSLCAMKALLFMVIVPCSLLPCAADTSPVNKVVQLLPALELQIKNRESSGAKITSCEVFFVVHGAVQGPRIPRGHTPPGTSE